MLLSMRAYKRLLQAAEDLEDIRAADEARAEDGEPIPWEEVKAELRAKPVADSAWRHDVVAMAPEPDTARKASVQYVVDENGKRTAVLVPIELFEELVELAEQLEDIRHLEANEAVPGEPMPWEQFVAELRAEGKLAREPFHQPPTAIH